MAHVTDQGLKDARTAGERLTTYLEQKYLDFKIDKGGQTE
jgi:hypothetical protein